MEQRRRLLRFVANLGTGAALVLAGMAMGYSVREQARAEYINAATQDTTNTDTLRDESGANILFV